MIEEACSQDILWFVFYKDELILQHQEDGSFSIPHGKTPPVTPPSLNTTHRISPMSDGTEVRTFSLSNPLQESDSNPLCGDWELCGLRESFYKLPIELFQKAGKCKEILYWDEKNKYCGVCGSPLTLDTDISKRCHSCGNEVWAQVSTAIIVRINRGDELLLVKARNFRKNFYGLVAGFVETGESLEEAVCREVMEETGIHIKNLRYFDSQPWPFPCGLMVGFTAEYANGELHLQLSELDQGGWFHYKNLPTLPDSVSIARRLINDFLESKKDCQ